MNKKFKVGVRNHLEQFSLEPNQLAHLSARLQSASVIRLQSGRRSSPRKKRYAWSFGLAASLLGIVVGILLMLNMSGQPDATHMIRQIADEVAKNHLKKRPLEIRAQQIAQVQPYFSELDFAPTLSPVFAEIARAQQLGGGRYCSIQGVAAAQLRYFDAQGNYVTLFETAYDPAVFTKLPDVGKGEKPLQVYARGVQVSLWVEKGLLMAAVK